MDGWVACSFLFVIFMVCFVVLVTLLSIDFMIVSRMGYSLYWLLCLDTPITVDVCISLFINDVVQIPVESLNCGGVVGTLKVSCAPGGRRAQFGFSLINSSFHVSHIHSRGSLPCSLATPFTSPAHLGHKPANSSVQETQPDRMPYFPPNGAFKRSRFGKDVETEVIAKPLTLKNLNEAISLSFPPAT